MTKRCRKCSKNFKFHFEGDPTNQMCPRCFVMSEEFGSANLGEIGIYFGIASTGLFELIKICAQEYTAGAPGHETFVTQECLNCRLGRFQKDDGTWRSTYYPALIVVAREYGVDPLFVLNTLDQLSGRECYVRMGN